MSKLPTNIIRHPSSGVLWVDKTYGSKRMRESLRTKNVDLAKRRATEKIKAFVEAVESGKWQHLEQTRSKRSFASIGEVVEVFRQYAALQGMADSTVVSYVGKLRRIVQASHSGNWEKLCTSVLTPDLAHKYVEKFLVERSEAIREDGRLRQKTINMAQSQLTSAASIFSRQARGFYRDKKLKLPPLIAEFGPSPRYRSQVEKYRLPPVQLVESTLKAGYELTGTDRLVFLCAFDLACRGDEIAAATADWFMQDARGQWWMQVQASADWTPKGNEHRKPVPAGLMAELKAVFATRDTILPGDTHAERLELVQRGSFTKWMRDDLGWPTAKLAHELRKLRACHTYHHGGETGPLDARKLLGHSSINTTERYYSDCLGIPMELLPRFEHWKTKSENKKEEPAGV